MSAKHAVCLAATLITLISSGLYGQGGSKDPASGRYEVVELPLRPLAISDSGWVAGATADQHAATWSAKAGLFRVPLPSQFSLSECTGINSSGEAVGTASTADSAHSSAFLVQKGKVMFLPGQQSRASGINDAAWTVGQAILPGSKVAGPVFWKTGSPVEIDICCAGTANAINQQNLIAGDTYDRQGQYHAFLWDAAHGAHLIPVPVAESSSVLALNSQGEILLKAMPGGLFLYSAGKLNRLDIPLSTPLGLNQSDVIVGSFGPGLEAQLAFVWDRVHGTQNLNTLIPLGSGWQLEVASGINDRGEIVGWGVYRGNENVGFLLRPIAHQRKTAGP